MQARQKQSSRTKKILGTIFLKTLDVLFTLSAFFGLFFILAKLDMNLILFMASLIFVIFLWQKTIIIFLKNRIPHYPLYGKSSNSGGIDGGFE